MKTNVLITGCGSGIGEYCAKQLQEDNYRVFATCRDEDDVTKLKNAGLEAFKLDVTNSDDILHVVQKVAKLTDNKIDVLFNNAGYGQPGALEDLDVKHLKEQFETNFFGLHELTKEVIPYMRDNGYGRIICNSSLLGYVSMAYRGAYNASKYAVEGYCDTLRLELANSGIEVVLIEPGPISSKFRTNALRAFEQNIDSINSEHAKAYEVQLQRLQKKANSKFTLPPSAVYIELIRAIESNYPQARYLVTTPAKVLWWLRNLMPTKMLDKILKKFS